MHEESVVYAYNGVLFMCKETQNDVICKKIDEMRDHPVKWNEPQLDKYSMFSLIYWIWIQNICKRM